MVRNPTSGRDAGRARSADLAHSANTRNAPEREHRSSAPERRAVAPWGSRQIGASGACLQPSVDVQNDRYVACRPSTRSLRHLDRASSRRSSNAVRSSRLRRRGTRHGTAWGRIWRRFFAPTVLWGLGQTAHAEERSSHWHRASSAPPARPGAPILEHPARWPTCARSPARGAVRRSDACRYGALDAGRARMPPELHNRVRVGSVYRVTSLGSANWPPDRALPGAPVVRCTPTESAPNSGVRSAHRSGSLSTNSRTSSPVWRVIFLARGQQSSVWADI
jgi:hypothetical protein